MMRNQRMTKSRNDVSFVLAHICLKAGEVVAVIQARGCTVRPKADRSPVTEADYAAEAIITEQLALRFPGVPVVSEEDVATRGPPIVGRLFFLVDPLDGTREFIAGRKEFTVNIALVEDGAPVAGAIYAPLYERLWFGATTCEALDVAPGAKPDLANAHRIHVRKPPAEGMTAFVSRSHDDPETEAYLAQMPVAERRHIGSSIKFCRIAEGAGDVYPRLGETREWDVAAGHAILIAAGGAVTTPDGAPLSYGNTATGFRRPGFVATGGFRIGPAGRILQDSVE